MVFPYFVDFSLRDAPVELDKKPFVRGTIKSSDRIKKKFGLIYIYREICEIQPFSIGGAGIPQYPR